MDVWKDGGERGRDPRPAKLSAERRGGLTSALRHQDTTNAYSAKEAAWELAVKWHDNEFFLTSAPRTKWCALPMTSPPWASWSALAW